jgi:hypothetical protein
MRYRVSPHPASSGRAGDGYSSRLEPRILRRCQRWISRLPRISAHPAPPCDVAPGFPEPCIFQLHRRKASGFPRWLAPSAPTDGYPSLLGSRTVQLSRRCNSGLPRHLHLPALPAVNFRVAPNPLLQLRLRWIIGFPRLSHPPVLPLPRLRASPNPASTAGPMMTPQLDSNFASSA